MMRVLPLPVAMLNRRCKGFFLTGEIVIVVVNETRERVLLVGTEFKFGIQVLRNTLRHFGFGDPKVEGDFELLMEELVKHRTVSIILDR